MVTTEDALKHVCDIFEDSENSNPKNWKRIRKCVPMDRYELRVFQNRKDKDHFVTVWNASEPPYRREIEFNVFDGANWIPPKKGKFPVVLKEGCTGNIAFAIDVIEDSEDSEDGVDIQFCCGPEETDGAIDDSSECWEDKTLEEIFGDKDIEIGVSESTHVIHANKDESELIKKRLLKAGAVEYKDRRGFDYYSDSDDDD